jgi:hypothetical protein
MTYRRLLQFASEEIKKGKTHQEVYNILADQSKLNFQFIAETLRKIPSMPKRKRYRYVNYFLGCILLLLYFYEILIYLNDSSGSLAEIRLVYYLILLYPTVGALFYWRNSHFYTGIILGFGFTFSTLANFIPFAINSYGSNIFVSLLLLIGTAFSLFLNHKLQTDYSINHNKIYIEEPLKKDQVIFNE